MEKHAMQPNGQYEVNDQNRVRRVPNRGAYDQETVYRILDSTLIGHFAFDSHGSPCSIAMLFGRKDNCLLVHGATKSRLMQVIVSGEPISMSVAHMDGLVLAKSLFHHSMNYRSVTIFGRGKELSDSEEKLEALRSITDKMMPGRWQDARLPNAQEMKATSVAAIEIESASAKERTGGPVDEKDDLSLPHWAGVIPMRIQADQPIPSQRYSSQQNPSQQNSNLASEAPAYVASWREAFNSHEDGPSGE